MCKIIVKTPIRCNILLFNLYYNIIYFGNVNTSYMLAILTSGVPMSPEKHLNVLAQGYVGFFPVLRRVCFVSLLAPASSEI